MDRNFDNNEYAKHSAEKKGREPQGDAFVQRALYYLRRSRERIPAESQRERRLGTKAGCNKHEPCSKETRYDHPAWNFANERESVSAKRKGHNRKQHREQDWECRHPL